MKTQNGINDIRAFANQFRRTLKRIGRPILSCFLCSVFLALAVWTVSGGQRATGASERPSGTCDLPPPDAFQTTKQYVETFYPLWFTASQARDPNRLSGPDRVSPVYHSVVMINDDTLYSSAFLNLNPRDPRGSPVVILTMPSTIVPDNCVADPSVVYSVLILSPYGDVFDSAIPHGSPPPIPGQAYALVGPDYNGPIPEGTIEIQVPWNYPTLIVRTDKYHSFAEPSATPDYVNQINQATVFRMGIRVQTLSDYQDCPSGGYTEAGGFTDVEPQFPLFAIPIKTVTDGAIAEHPIDFLKVLQKAVRSPRTPPNTCARELSREFDVLFGDGNWPDNSPFGHGAQAAHAEIVNNYVNGHQIGANWTHFTNIGDWDPDDITLSNAIDRSSITEFCQFCNDLNSALYYHAFRDGAGQPLDGNNRYVLTFPSPTPPVVFNYPGPDTTRFWSLTAYTPQSIELVPNFIDRYVVASYSGAHLNPDGSLSIFMSPEPPAGKPIENWLPVPRAPFNVVLRDYGPGVSILPPNPAYTPPPIELLP
jgi:hypothetical protein